MPISTSCSHCQKKFRAPDNLAGKSVKCPACQGVVRVPAAENAPAGEMPVKPPGGSSASWYILTENREQMGPVSKEQLDNLATKGRLSFCQIRRGDWRAWKWADDVYPELPPSLRKESEEATAADDEEPDSARLVLCPDCGNTVSRRATQCPHCGCPAAVLLKQNSTPGDAAVGPAPPSPLVIAPEPTAEGVEEQPPKSRLRRRLILAGALALLIAVIGTPAYFVWKTWKGVDNVVQQLTEPAAPKPEPIPESEEPGEELLSPEGKKAYIDEAARKMAEYIDELQRQHHLPLAMISQTADSVKMLEKLAGGDLDAIPESTSAVPGGSGVEPYESQVDELFLTCRDWVRDNVKRGACTRADVWAVARQWAEEKRDSVLEPLGGLSVEGLTPSPIPEDPQP